MIHLHRKLAYTKAIEIIGEVCRQLTLNPLPETKSAKIPWRDLIDTRNKFTHEYFRIDVPAAYALVQQILLPLQPESQRLFEEFHRQSLLAKDQK